MRRRVSRLFFMAAWLVMAVWLAPFVRTASAASDTEVIQQVNITQLVEIMKKEGYSVELDDENILWKIDGSNCLVLTYDDGKAIQFYVGFMDVKTSMNDLNEWNKSKRFSRTYLDDDGDPCLELDLDLAGGVTLARMHDFFRTCAVSFKKWHKEIIEE